jgi:hypothetical protein
VTTQENIEALLKQCEADDASAVCAHMVVNRYEQRVRNINATDLTTSLKEKAIEIERQLLLGALANILEPFDLTEVDPAAAIAGEASAAAIITPDEMKAHLLHAGLVQLAAELVRCWDAVGVLGFACRDQSEVPNLLAGFANLRTWLAVN